MRGGDLILFYQSKDEAALHSQCLTNVGVVEQVRRASDADELRRLTAGRSVFSESDLKTLADGSPSGITVIDFLLIGQLNPVLHLDELREVGVLKAHPQSVTSVRRSSLPKLSSAMRFGFAL